MVLSKGLDLQDLITHGSVRPQFSLLPTYWILTENRFHFLLRLLDRAVPSWSGHAKAASRKIPWSYHDR